MYPWCVNLNIFCNDLFRERLQCTYRITTHGWFSTVSGTLQKVEHSVGDGVGITSMLVLG